MNLTQYSLLIQALRRQNYEKRPPVWFMRQAGRYLPAYRQLRARYSFLEMCHQPALIAEVTQLPIDILGVDGAILFADILLPLEAFGLGLQFHDSVGPVIERPLTPESNELPAVSMAEELAYVGEGIRELKKTLKVPLLGFAGAPFTVASYAIEGKTCRDWRKTKLWMLKDPTSFHRLLKTIATATIDYLNMQIDAGVDAIQIFDSWAHCLGAVQFREFSLAYMRLMIQALKSRGVPIILFCRGSSVFAGEMTAIGADAISIDWNADITKLRRWIPTAAVALQGNLDPDLLLAPPNKLLQEAAVILDGMYRDPGYIFNLGHGIHPETPVDTVKALVEFVKSR